KGIRLCYLKNNMLECLFEYVQLFSAYGGSDCPSVYQLDGDHTIAIQPANENEHLFIMERRSFLIGTNYFLSCHGQKMFHQTTSCPQDYSPQSKNKVVRQINNLYIGCQLFDSTL
ncbi:hypothetical protein KTE19_12185, partial [Lentilactobacillus sp. IMAU92037]|uniref:hypothetical protein n=1 Tax=Lentilactobacillus dabitei TaxID=2831523 RepID=UPI001C2BC709